MPRPPPEDSLLTEDPPSGANGSPASQQPLNRACESCRVLKVRCLPDDANPSAPCQRCSRTGRTCLFAPPQRRKPRKRTDARVAELEREVRAMRIMLAESRAQNAANPDKSVAKSVEQSKLPAIEPTSDFNDLSRASSIDDSETPPTSEPQERVNFQISLGGQYRAPENMDAFARPGDIVDRGLITMETAEELFELYLRDLNDQYPGVSIPKGATAHNIRETKPVLWLAILSASVMSVDANLAALLNHELIRTLADHVFIKGEKSMELVEALHVTVVYHYPPAMTNRLLLFQYSHLATGMVVELGLGSKPANLDQPTSPQKETILDHALPEDLLDRCRSLLSSYLFTSGLAMRLRRPSLLPFNNWMSEALDLLACSSDIANRRTAVWVKLHRITEETAMNIGLDDASTQVELSDVRLQAALKNFERRMDDWKKSTDPDLFHMFMKVDYYFNFVTIYEFAMDGGKHDAGEFKRKHFTLPSLDGDAPLTETRTRLSGVQIDATIKCVTAVQKLLDEVLKIDTHQLRSASNVIYVRVLYSVVFLLRVSMQANVTSLGDFLDPASIRAEYYLNSFERKISDAAAPQGFRVPSHWLTILTSKGKPWLKKFKLRISSQNSPADGGGPSDTSAQDTSGPPVGSETRAGHHTQTNLEHGFNNEPKSANTTGFDYNRPFDPSVPRAGWPYSMEAMAGGSNDSSAAFFQNGMMPVAEGAIQYDFTVNGPAPYLLGFGPMNGNFDEWAQNENFNGHFM